MPAQVSPFTKIVVQAVRKLYPEELADKSFDNTGVLLEAPYRSHLRNSVLLTVDLTKGVVDEAIRRKDSLIIAYHPIIFRPLTSLTTANSQQNSLLRLAQEGISVYSPHTACDAAPGGLNDWLADIITKYHHDSNESIPHGRKVITPVTSVVGMEGAGYGRVITFSKPQRLVNLIHTLTHGIEDLRTGVGISVAVPQVVPVSSKADIRVSSVGLCAGSGGSVLKSVDVDMLLTGELSHHQALAAIEEGKVVVTTFHSNSERGFLRDSLRHKLQCELKEIFDQMSDSERDYIFKDKDNNFEAHDSREVLKGQDEQYTLLRELPWQIAMSKVDRDPFEIVQTGRGANLSNVGLWELGLAES